MKRILLFAVLAAVMISCNLDGYSEYTMTSVSNFEYNDDNGQPNSNVYVDSLYLISVFTGGSGSYYNDSGSYTSGSGSSLIVFNSQRATSGAEMTGGFGLSVKKDSSLVLKEENLYPQYTMYATSAAMSSKGCAVFYQNSDESKMPEHDIIFNDSDATESTCYPAYCMINNSQLTVYNVLSDDSPLKFGPGDYLKLKITGLYEGLETGSVEYYLANYGSESEKIDSVLTTWKTVSLSKLGQIQYIDFKMETNKEDFPMTFCFDNFVTSLYLKY